MSPIIEKFMKNDHQFSVVHTGQHYSFGLDKIFFEELELPVPNHNLNVGSGTHAQTTAKILVGMEDLMMSNKPKVLLVEGDTNSVVAPALAAVKLHVKVGHVEAGLRSHDKRMPEEHNRILTDHISDYLFAPTEIARQNLLKENIEDSRIFVTGNTIVDAVNRNLNIANKKSDILNQLGLDNRNYFLMTLHREENVDDKKIFLNFLNALNIITKKYKMPIIYPIHPRTRNNIKKFGFENKISNDIKLIDPIGYLDFLKLEENAKLVLTDSGGVQEETCILKVPCVTLRLRTERPETVEIGSNMVTGLETNGVIDCVDIMFNKKNNWGNPFGDGDASGKILKILKNEG